MTTTTRTARTLRRATQIHPLTGQEVADLEDVTARPATAREWRRYVDLAGVRGRHVYITVDDGENTRGGFLVASSQGYDEAVAPRRSACP